MSSTAVEPTKTRYPKINWLVVLFLSGYHVLALAAFAFPFEARYIPIMIGMYLWMGFATTFYLHRCLTHRAFETTNWIKFLCFLGSAVGQQGDPVNWVGHHRRHHQKSDHAGDVHSPVVDGFLFSHVGWILVDARAENAEMRALARDVEATQPYLRWFVHRWTFFLPHLAMAATLAYTLGVGGMLWCLYVPMIAVYHVTWSVNSLCHMFGYRTTPTSDDSRNFWLIGLLALGEGWHNNHHASQTRAPQGLVWYEIDLTTYLIWTLEKVGLVWNVKWDAPKRTLTSTEPLPELGGTPANVPSAD